MRTVRRGSAARLASLAAFLTRIEGLMTRAAGWSLALTVATLVSLATAATSAVTDTTDGARGSLSEAIIESNETPGHDTLEFAIQGAGPHTITPAGPFPAITDPVTIDGYTQDGGPRRPWPCPQP